MLREKARRRASPRQINPGQSFAVVSAETGAGATGTLALRVAGPNPFRGTTAVAIAVADIMSDTRVERLDALGRRVAVLHSGPLAAGELRIAFEGSRLAPGVYVVRAHAGRETALLRVVIGR